MLIEKLRKELTLAMKEDRKNDKEVLRMVIAGIINKEKETGRTPSEQEELDVVAKEIKQMKESIETAPKDRTEFIETNLKKISFLETYLPAQLTMEEIRDVIKSVLITLGIEGKVTPADKGKIMKELMPKVKGKSDGQVVNAMVMELFKN